MVKYSPWPKTCELHLRDRDNQVVVSVDYTLSARPSDRGVQAVSYAFKGSLPGVLKDQPAGMTIQRACERQGDSFQCKTTVGLPNRSDRTDEAYEPISDASNDDLSHSSIAKICLNLHDKATDFSKRGR